MSKLENYPIFLMSPAVADSKLEPAFTRSSNDNRGASSIPCYICGLSGTDSRDHVIPDCFFADSRPDHLVTLPAHHECHGRLDEEYARDILAGLGSDSSAAARSLWNSKIERSILRNRRLRRSIRASLIPRIDLVSPAGLFFDQTPAFRIERDRFYPSMRKIIQGMYAIQTGRLLPPTFRSSWNLNATLEMNDERRRFLEASQFGVVYPGVFACRYLITTEGDKESSLWWLRFYDNVVLRCFVPPRHFWSPLIR